MASWFVGRLCGIKDKSQTRSGAGAMREKSHEAIEKSHELERITEEISRGMWQTAAGADQIDGAVNHVNDISRKNKRQIEALIGKASRFKVN